MIDVHLVLYELSLIQLIDENDDRCEIDEIHEADVLDELVDEKMVDHDDEVEVLYAHDVVLLVHHEQTELIEVIEYADIEVEGEVEVNHDYPTHDDNEQTDEVTELQEILIMPLMLLIVDDEVEGEIIYVHTAHIDDDVEQHEQ